MQKAISKLGGGGGLSKSELFNRNSFEKITKENIIKLID